MRTSTMAREPWTSSAARGNLRLVLRLRARVRARLRARLRVRLRVTVRVRVRVRVMEPVSGNAKLRARAQRHTPR